jgi:hypothetical protein
LSSRTDRVLLVVSPEDGLAMGDVLIGLAFVAMVLLPAVVASYQRAKSNDHQA